MSWSRAAAGRLCAAAQASRSPGSCLVRVKASGPRHVTETLRRGHSVHWGRSLCVSGDPLRAHLRKLSQLHPVRDQGRDQDRDRDRVETVATSLSEGRLHLTRPPPPHAYRRAGSRVPAASHALFTGNCGGSGRRCSTSSTMQHSRASSAAAAAAKRRDEAGEQELTTHGSKADEQNLKEASAASSSTEKAPGEPEPEGGKPTKTQQLKKVFKEYGAVGVCFHIGISLMSLGMSYLLISSGVDMTAVLCKLGFSEAVVRSKMAAGTSTFFLAYALHKLFAPVRISTTLVSVPLIVRYFRKTGLFKPPTP